MTRKVYAAYDDEGIYVYQAFRPKIVAVAVELGKFGKGFGLDRTSWIKPSFAWTLRRSKYATKHRMDAIAQVKITHEAFLGMLKQSVEAHFNPAVYADELEWKRHLDRSEVIHQWDPERSLEGRRLDRQAIQIALKGESLRKYAQEDIVEITDVTALAHEIGRKVKQRSVDFPPVLEEREYPLQPELFTKLGCVE